MEGLELKDSKNSDVREAALIEIERLHPNSWNP